jgi:hypothetical protein
MAPVISLNYVKVVAPLDAHRYRMRAWTNERHVSAYDIDELRKFIHACPSQKATDVRDAWVSLARPRFS